MLATLWLVALCEQATVAAVAGMLSPNETSVGVHVDIEHLIASTSGATVTATAEIQSFDHSRFVCSVDAYEGSDLVGRGTIVRVRVDRQRFVRDRGKL